MTVLVALLRGVNVGGRTSLPMAELRALASGLGYGDVRTYIQSGNLVLTSDDPPDRVARALEQAIAASTTVAPAVLVRTRDELGAVVDDDPFRRRGAEEQHLHVVFTEGDAAAGLDGLDVASFAPEEVAAVGSELHLLLPGGVGRSRLAIELGRRAGARGTMRSWRTVTKLVALAQAIDG